MNQTTRYSSTNTIATVANREIQVALRSKGIILSFIIVLLVTLIGIGVANWYVNRDTVAPKVAMVGVETSAFADSGFELFPMDNRDEALYAVENNQADAAFLITDNQAEVAFDGEPDPTLTALVQSYLESRAQIKALTALDVDPAAYANQYQPIPLTMTDLKSSDTDSAAIFTALIGVSIITFFIMLFAGHIGSRVTEEKSSRIIEIILASVRTGDFLRGKLVGNLLVGISGSTFVLIVAGIAFWLSGLGKDIDFRWPILPLLILVFIIGLLFFGALYAAAGSLVSRAEDLQSTQTPVTILSLAMIYAPLFGLSTLDSPIMQICSWLPPISLSVVPVQVAAGNMSIGLGLLSLALTTTVTAGILAVAAKIYRNAILLNGRKVKWGAALKG